LKKSPGLFKGENKDKKDIKDFINKELDVIKMTLISVTYKSAKAYIYPVTVLIMRKKDNRINKERESEEKKKKEKKIKASRSRKRKKRII
jgi:hypothetical protein